MGNPRKKNFFKKIRKRGGKRSDLARREIEEDSGVRETLVGLSKSSLRRFCSLDRGQDYAKKSLAGRVEVLRSMGNQICFGGEN